MKADSRMRDSTNSITTILFDWDGTLADSAGLGLAAFQKTFAELGVALPLDAYEASYSPNWYATYEALGLPKDRWQRADELWMMHYGQQSADLIAGVAGDRPDVDLTGRDHVLHLARHRNVREVRLQVGDREGRIMRIETLAPLARSHLPTPRLPLRSVI